MDDYTRSRFILAVNKFNIQDFFECHEILEDIWFDTRDESRDFYQGLLHIAVGLHHLSKKNNKGTILQLDKAIAKLALYEKNYNGIDLEKLLKQITAINKNLAKKKLPLKFPKIILL